MKSYMDRSRNDLPRVSSDLREGVLPDLGNVFTRDSIATSAGYHARSLACEPPDADHFSVFGKQTLRNQNQHKT